LHSSPVEAPSSSISNSSGGSMTTEINTLEEEFIPRRRAWLLLAQLALCFSLYCVLSYFLPHDRYIRYQQLVDSDLFRSRWVYERIHYDKTPIDVAIIGDSRVETSVSAPILEKELSEKLGRPIHVANLAIPQGGRNLHFLVAREVVENHPETRIILLSVAERVDLSHPAFRYLADPIDLLRAPLILNHYYFLDAAFLPYRQMSYFGQTYFPAWFGLSRTFRKDYMGTGFDTTYSFYLPNGKLVDRYHVMPQGELEDGSRQVINELGGPWREPSRWQALNNPLENEYTKRLVEVAKEHSVETIFVRLPFYKSPPHMYDEAFYRSLGPLLDAEQLNDNPQNYGDRGHFNRYGTDLVSAWLKEAIEPYLGPLETSVSASK
jgi:hypothetical protein